MNGDETTVKMVKLGEVSHPVEPFVNVTREFGKVRVGTLHRRRKPLLYFGIAVLVLAGALFLAYWYFFWPREILTEPTNALASVHLSGIGGKVEKASATYGGSVLPLRDVDGNLFPVKRIPVGTRVSVSVQVRRPSWESWLVGTTSTVTAELTTPKNNLVDHVATVQPGQSVSAVFSSPVEEVEISSSTSGVHYRYLHRPSTKVVVVSSVAGGVGSVVNVAGISETWESMPSTSPLTYFGSVPHATVMMSEPNLVSGVVEPASSIRLTFSTPVRSTFGNSYPTITPVIPGALVPSGKWSSPTPYSMLFTPSGVEFWSGEQFTLTMPSVVILASTPGPVSVRSSSSKVQSIEFSAITGSTLRLQQLLATLNYLPLSWTPSQPSGSPTTVAGQVALMASAPPGTFSWKWTTLAGPLSPYWSPGSMNVVTQGAIETFEQVSHLDTTGTANPLLWPTLIQAVISHQLDPHEYSWIDVSQSLPETLTVYRNGVATITSATNTGIPQDPSTPGTFPIYLRLPFQIMKGTNPNGTKYADPVHWVNYYNGSQAVHGFVRASYGFPQSLGCAELPVAVAQQVWPVVHIGTLVTVTPQT